MVPYFYDQNLDEENKNPSQGVQISGASPTTDSSGGEVQGSHEKGLNTGSGFQNLDKYLNTNESQQFGNQVLGKVQNEINTAGQNQEVAGQRFQDQVATSNKLPTTEQVNSAIANPTSADAKQFQGWESQTYTGPKSLAESPDVWNQYWSGSNKANTSAQLLGSEPGRFTLLDSYYGKPSYNFGEKSLDNLLIQQSGLGRQTKDVQNQATQLQATGNQQAGALQNAASQRAGEVEQNRNSVRAAIGLDDQGNVITGDKAGAIGQQYQKVEDQLTAANAARKAATDQVIAHAGAGQFTADELKQLGLSGGENVYNLNLADYLTPGEDLNKNQTMTPEQRAYIQALSQLSGTTDTFASGTAQDKTNPYAFNVEKLTQASKAKQADYQRALQESPVVIPKQWTVGGQGKPIPIAELEQRIAWTQDLLNRGQRVNGGQQFLNDVLPILAQAKQDIGNQYQINRKIGVNG